MHMPKKSTIINATFTFPLVICFVLVLSLNKFKKAFKKSIKINFSNKHMAYLKIKKHIKNYANPFHHFKYIFVRNKVIYDIILYKERQLSNSQEKCILDTL